MGHTFRCAGFDLGVPTILGLAESRIQHTSQGPGPNLVTFPTSRSTGLSVCCLAPFLVEQIGMNDIVHAYALEAGWHVIVWDRDGKQLRFTTSGGQVMYYAEVPADVFAVEKGAGS